MDQKFKNRRIFLPHTVWLFMQLCEKINNVTINTFDGMFQSPLPLPKGEKNARSTSHVNHSKALIFSRPLCLNIFFQVHPGWMLRCPYYDRHTHTHAPPPHQWLPSFSIPHQGEHLPFISILEILHFFFRYCMYAK